MGVVWARSQEVPEGTQDPVWLIEGGSAELGVGVGVEGGGMGGKDAWIDVGVYQRDRVPRTAIGISVWLEPILGRSDMIGVLSLGVGRCRTYYLRPKGRVDR